MKPKTDKTQWLAWLGLMTEFTFAFAFSQYTIISLVLLYFALAGVFSFVVVHLWCSFIPRRHEKLLIVWPVVGLLAFADILFRFNTVFPFVLLTVLLWSGNVLFAAADERENRRFRPTDVLLIACITSAGYLILTMSYGIFS